MKGTKIETFDAEVLGVLKNTSPGRDMVLCRLSGLNLEKTGVIAGMSGSPVYIDGKLLGAVAYAWPFGKEPIAGITPFCQMHGFVEAYERRDLAEQRQADPRRPAHSRCRSTARSSTRVTVSQGFDDPQPTAADGLWMVPLRTPLAATGFTPHSLKLLRERCAGSGLVPMQGGGAAGKIAEEEKDTPLEPGGPLAVALITGDFDLSGIGTVTHIEGNRVYGWGHPFMGLGGCEFPLMTGYIHTIYPRQTRQLQDGLAAADRRRHQRRRQHLHRRLAGPQARHAAGAHDRVARRPGRSRKTFNVEMVRQRSLLPTLVFTALTNSVDMEGELPEELTAELQARIEVEGQAADRHQGHVLRASAAAGRRRPCTARSPRVVNLLTYNSYKPRAHQPHRVRHARSARPAHRRHRGGRAGLRHLRARRDASRRRCSCGRTRGCGSACRCP